MTDFFISWREILQSQIVPPWQKIEGDDDEAQNGHVMFWIVGWIMTLAGIIGTGIFAPYLVILWHVPIAYQNYAVIGFAFVGGLSWQFSFTALVHLFVKFISVNSVKNMSTVLFIVTSILFFIIIFTPLELTGFLVYWYFAHFAPHHSLVGSGILGATILKLLTSIGIPFVKSFVTGRLFRWSIKKIRGEPVKPSTTKSSN